MLEGIEKLQQTSPIEDLQKWEKQGGKERIKQELQQKSKGSLNVYVQSLDSVILSMSKQQQQLRNRMNSIKSEQQKLIGASSTAFAYEVAEQSPSAVQVQKLDDEQRIVQKRIDANNAKIQKYEKRKDIVKEVIEIKLQEDIDSSSTPNQNELNKIREEEKKYYELTTKEALQALEEEIKAMSN